MRPISRRLKSTCTLTLVTLSEEPNEDGEQETTETTVEDVPTKVDQKHTREGGVSEDPAKQEVERERCLFFFNPDVNIDALAKITWRGRVFEVDGMPSLCEKNGEIHHLEVHASRTV